MTSEKYEQDKRRALAKWFADGCPFEEDEEVLGAGRSNSVSSTGHVDGNTFYTQDWSTHIPGKASSLNTSAGRTKATDFCKDNKYRGKDFKPGKLSGPVEILKRDDRKSKPIKSIERTHWQK
ncbi:8061_t:CDS:2 [Paraglomus occultum]|uniref:8061_t:CDS:1 n=1 Tax=Paraglomus occultum TaxID=144539 RepID=A0A9N9CFW0_9GLOM|nr:8061_t:CDS:2 [Paraglomus occultum]